MSDATNPGPPARCFDDCPTNRTGNSEDCTCLSAGTPLDSDAALFARQRDDAQAILLHVSRILGISHLKEGLEHGRITDAVRYQMDAELRLTKERDSALAKAARLAGERDDALADREAARRERDEMREQRDMVKVELGLERLKTQGAVDAAERWCREQEAAQQHLDKVRQALKTPDGWATKMHALRVRQQRDAALAELASRPAIPADRPHVVCLSGSMRFESEMQEVARHESVKGHIVVMPNCNMKHPHELWASDEQAEAVKTALDGLHFAKIDLADEIVVVSDASGYIGDSTRSEIAYAEAHGKPVRFWSAPVSGSDTTGDGGDRG